MDLVGPESEVDTLGEDDGSPPVELLPGGGFGDVLSEDDGGVGSDEVDVGGVTVCVGGDVVPPPAAQRVLDSCPGIAVVDG
ncbi:hypothetical protein ACFFRC_16965, partial [Amycolatopsis halotolerans]|uniref:hypothetical protein n=1 Tax=Amycolatopsis halotolerans TaxID=330083 RepID=UPI0035ECDDDD